MHLIRQEFNVKYSFPVIFTRDAFNPENPALYNTLRESGHDRNRALVIVDSHVLGAFPGLPDKIQRYATHYNGIMELVESPYVIKGGEISKKEPHEINRIQELIGRHHLCRHSFILAIGGGAALDAAGFAAATAHRGIRLIRMPTTTLAQNDAGVGVKNGINAFDRKNFIGTFSPPFAILNDFEFLKTLNVRDLRAGISEALKVAIIKDRAFFDFLFSKRCSLAAFRSDVMEQMIIRCAELHLEHIRTSGDPFEFGSSRPLDFGHWSAHKIEEVTGGDVKHGEAVAIGIALDSLYSHHIGLLSEMDQARIFMVLEDIGFPLYHWSLDWLDIEKALREFQEHLGGELTITLPRGIGATIEIHEADIALYKQCISMLAKRNKEKGVTHERSKLSDDCKRGPGYLLY